MNPSIRRRSAPFIAGIAAMATLLVPIDIATASSSRNLEDFAVSVLTPDHRSEVGALRQALAERGIEQDGIRVFTIPTKDGATTVITRTPNEFVASATGGGIYELTRIEAALPSVDVPARQGVHAQSDSAEWTRSNADCDIYSTEAFARTQCFEISRQAGDTDGRHAYWQYTAESTGHSKGHREMERIWVERKPADGSPRQEFDGIPEPKEARNKEENCVQKTEGISIGSGAPVQIGFSKSWTRMSCETYRPKMYDDEGHWATIWEGNPNVGKKDSRHVMFTMPVKTAEHDLPAWVRLNGQRTT